MGNTRIYKEEELLVTNASDCNDYNHMEVHLETRCACGGNVQPNNKDKGVFFGADGMVVIVTNCDNCDKSGTINIHINLAIKKIVEGL